MCVMCVMIKNILVLEIVKKYDKYKIPSFNFHYLQMADSNLKCVKNSTLRIDFVHKYYYKIPKH